MVKFCHFPLIILLSSALYAQNAKNPPDQHVKSPSPRWDFRLIPWYPTLRGDMKFEEESMGGGDRWNLQDDLGGGEGEPVGIFELAHVWDDWRLSFSYQQMRFSSEEILPTSKRFDESVFAGGELTQFRTKLREIHFDLEKELYQDDTLSFWGGLSAKYLYVEPRISSASAGTENDNLGVLYPELKLRSALKLSENWALDAEAAGGYFSSFKVFARNFSLQGGLRCKLGASASLLGGYRVEHIELTSTRAENENNDVNFQLGGPFLAIGVRF